LGGCLYEPKWDGWRGLLLRNDDGRLHLRSRAGRRLDPYVPDVLRAAGAVLPQATALDGEIVAWRAGRTDFGALQQRLAAGRRLSAVAAFAPAYFVAFDALILTDRDLRDQPLVQRRAELEALLADGADRLLLCPQTRDEGEARAWAVEMAPLGVEGIVVKPANSRYRAGRGSGWKKWRSRHTTEAVVGGLTGTRDRPETLLLGRFSADGRLRVVGRTSRLTDAQAAEIAPLLHPPGAGRQRARHPWPQPLPAGWLGHFGEQDALAYRPTEPDVVVEVSADSAYEQGRWRHPPRYVRHRADLSPWDTPPHRWSNAD